jgi:hypothetical protein
MITKPKKKSQILRFNRKLSSQACKRGESMPREKKNTCDDDDDAVRSLHNLFKIIAT